MALQIGRRYRLWPFEVEITAISGDEITYKFLTGPHKGRSKTRSRSGLTLLEV